MTNSNIELGKVKKVSCEDECANKSNYYYDAKKRLWHSKDGDDKGEIVSNTYIEVIAFARSMTKDDWTAFIKFRDLDGEEREVQIPNEKFTVDGKESLRLLANAGFPPSDCNKGVVEYFRHAITNKRKIRLTRSGWIGEGLEYTCQSFHVGDKNKEYLFINNGRNGLSQSGSLKEWQDNVFRYCVGNHILTLSLCVGLAGPLLNFLPDINTTVINLTGQSSIGKSTSLNVAGSLWGNKKFIKQWRSTTNALEAIAENHNDGLLVLDELEQINGKEVSNTFYMLGNERGKSRMNADSTLRQTKSWKISILSSGEVRIPDKIEEAGNKVKAGQLVRCIDIDACVSNYGIYNYLHGTKSGAELSDLLIKNCAKYYGMASAEFVRKLIESNTYENLKDSIVDEVDTQFKRLSEKFELGKAHGQVQRVAKVFALYGATGNYASRFEIFTQFEEQLEESIDYAFDRWLEDRGNKGASEEIDIVESLYGFLLQNDFRFGNLNSIGDKAIINCLGYKKKEIDRTIYYIFPDLFRKEFSIKCLGKNHKTIRNFLLKHGIIVSCEKNDNRDKRIPLPNGIRKRMTTIVIDDNLE